MINESLIDCKLHWGNNRPVVIIPARSGSKRILDKNIKKFLGVPVIERVVNLLKEMEIFEEIFVSTDSLEIKRIAQLCGAKVPFMRPHSLAKDDIPTLPVIQHAIKKIIPDSNKLIFCVYPTSIFLEKSIVLDALDLLNRSPNSIVFPIKRYPSPVERRMEYDLQTEKVRITNPEVANLPTQLFQEFWYDVSEFYVAISRVWEKSTSLYSNAAGVAVDNHISVDINNPRDWKFAERLISGLSIMEE